MSMARRIGRQARRNVQSDLIRRAQLTGKRKKMARRFLKRRDKNERFDKKRLDEKRQAASVTENGAQKIYGDEKGTFAETAASAP